MVTHFFSLQLFYLAVIYNVQETNEANSLCMHLVCENDNSFMCICTAYINTFSFAYTEGMYIYSIISTVIHLHAYQFHF